jgi:hypothetical protein
MQMGRQEDIKLMEAGEALTPFRKALCRRWSLFLRFRKRRNMTNMALRWQPTAEKRSTEI